MSKKIHIKDYIIAFLEKTLAPAKMQEMQEHISSCEPCRLFYEKFSAVYLSGNSLKKPELNPYFYTRVVAKLQSESGQEYVLPSTIVRSLRPVAAGLFLLTAITFSIFFGNYILSDSSQTQVVNELSYDYYLGNSEDPMLNTIMSNEN